MSTQIVDIIDTFLSGLDFSQEILSHSDDGTNTTIEVANLFHSRAKLTIDIDGSDYTIVSVTEPDTIVVSGVIADPLVATIQSLFYFHGTPYATNSHLSAIRDWRNKVPFAYLLEIIRERVFGEADSVNEREADIRLFLLDDANFEDWTTDEHYSKRINGLRRTSDFIVQELGSSSLFNDINFVDVISHAKFGVYVDNKGHENSVFDEQLSGVEMRFTLPVIKNLKCN